MKIDWETMTIDELFALRELMQHAIGERLQAKKLELERRLQILNKPLSHVGPTKKSRRTQSAS